MKKCEQCRQKECCVANWERRTPTLFVARMGSFAGVVGWATHWVVEIEWETAVPCPSCTTHGPDDRGKPPWVLEPWRGQVELYPRNKLASYDRRFTSKEQAIEDAIAWFELHKIGDDVLLATTGFAGTINPSQVLAGPAHIVKEGNRIWKKYEKIYEKTNSPSEKKTRPHEKAWRELMRPWGVD